MTMVNSQGDGLEYNSAQSWEAARNYASLLGEVPNSFSTLIRSQSISLEKKDSTMGDVSRFQMLRLLRGPSMKAVVYFAGLTFHGERISEASALSPKELVQAFNPLELAAAVAVTYLFRTARKVSPPEDFAYLADNLHTFVDLGTFLGLAIPNISPAFGMLAGALPYIAQATFLKHDEKGFKDYRRALKSSTKRWLPDYEMKRWGCTSVQVASILIQTVGFGVTIADRYTRGLSSEKADDLDDAAFAYYIGEVWLASLMKSEKAPEITHRGSFYPLQKDLDLLVERVKKLRTSGSEHKWLEKGKNDISPEATPALFAGGERPAVSTPTAAPAAATGGTELLDEIKSLEESGE